MTLQVQQDSFEALEGEWKELAPRSPGGSVFTTPVWLRAWWESFGASEDLLLLAFREGGKLRGVAPLMRGGGAIRFVAHSDVCDYHDFVFDAAVEGEFYPALVAALDGLRWESLALEGLAEGSPTLARLPALARERGLAVEQSPDGVSPWSPLGRTWEEHLQGLSKKDRHELRRKLRRLEAAGTVACKAVQTPPADGDMDAFLGLLRKSREEKAAFLNEGRERFFRRLATAMAREGQLRLFFLELDGLRVAGSLCFDYDGGYYLYNSGYDPRFSPLSAGLLLKAMCVKDAIERGRARFDFLRGPEPYKYDLGARDRRLYRLVIRRAPG